MKTDLIGSAAWANIYHTEMEKFCSHTKENDVTTRIAGIECLDPKAKNDLLDRLKKGGEEYMAVIKELNENGIDREGILPKEVFLDLITQKKLFSFHKLDEKGCTDADMANFLRELKMSNRLDLLQILSVFAGSMLFIALQMVIFAIDTSAWAAIGIAVIAVILRTLISVLCGEENMRRWLKFIFPEIILTTFFWEKHVWWQAKHLLWSKRNDIEIENQYINGFEKNETLVEILKSKVRVQLAPAPDRVQKRVLACRDAGYVPYLVVDEYAFTVDFGEKLKSLIKTVILPHDPMPCIDIGNYVVIIDQYGGFLSEQEVVEYTQKNFSLLKKEFSIIDKENKN